MSILSFLQPLNEISKAMEEREDGYRAAVLSATKAILQAEDRHRLAATSIKQDVGREIERVVSFLVEARRD